VSYRSWLCRRLSYGAWFSQHQVATDVGLAVAFVLFDTVTTLAGATWWPAHPGTLAWAMLALQAAAGGTLVIRRRAPLTVVAILAAFTLLVTLLISPAGLLTPANPDNVWAPFSTVLAAYGPVFYLRDRRVTFLALAVLTVVAARPWEASITFISLALLRTAVGPLLALYFGARRRLVQALTERAERAERERYLLAEQARAQERTRLAGEMHDVVTHRVSLMVLQAGALQITATDEQTRKAAEELRAAGCQALDELRDLVGILRTGPAEDETAAPPDFAALVAESTAVGAPAELVEEGDPALASPVVGRTAYRVVREGLTNVRKHAPGALVTVRLSYAEAQVQVTVTNTAPPATPALPGSPGSALASTGSGLGIASLRQRIELVHGTLQAGGTPEGGFRLAVTLPAYVPTAQQPADQQPADQQPAAQQSAGQAA
jgi:signal transduction histidine kinase